MLNKQINLFHTSFPQIFSDIKENFPYSVYDFKKHVIQLENVNREEVGYLRLPLYLSINQEFSIIDTQTIVAYLCIESGNAALCLLKGNDMIYHTTFSAYMNRKKQGFNQIKYLNKKGKSRAGSRVRLAATFQFFDNINEKLTTVFEDHSIERIGLHCSPTLIPYLHQGKIPCPFQKQDPRIYKIPVHMPQANYGNLHSAIKKLMAPIIFHDEKYESAFDPFRVDNH